VGIHTSPSRITAGISVLALPDYHANKVEGEEMRVGMGGLCLFGIGSFADSEGEIGLGLGPGPRRGTRARRRAAAYGVSTAATGSDTDRARERTYEAVCSGRGRGSWSLAARWVTHWPCCATCRRGGQDRRVVGLDQGPPCGGPRPAAETASPCA
jgi:hypothetical protein